MEVLVCRGDAAFDERRRERRGNAVARARLDGPVLEGEGDGFAPVLNTLRHAVAAEPGISQTPLSLAWQAPGAERKARK